MTEVPWISRAILGEKGKFNLKCKAMQTRALVPFSIYLLEKFGAGFDRTSVALTVGRSLERLIVLMRLGDGKVSGPTYQVSSALSQVSTDINLNSVGRIIKAKTYISS